MKLSSDDADDIVQQYYEFITDCVPQQILQFTGFDPINDRVDKLMFDNLANKPHYAKLWAVFKILLLLSHGQATVERGFSINRTVESDNLQECTFEAQRLIVDHVNDIGGICNIDVNDKQLLLSISGARHRYQLSLEENKKMEAQLTGQKRKAVSDKVDQLKQKKNCMEYDIAAMLKSADEFGEQAEKA